MFNVVITRRAELDMQNAVNWWRDNRSPEQAEHWYTGILLAMESLSRMPQRCRVIKNSQQLGREVRQLLYGVRSTITHRVYFEIDGGQVIVYRVLSTSQSLPKKPDDLTP